MKTKPNVIISVSATASSFLDADKHLNVDRVKALNLKVTEAVKKYNAKADKPAKALQIFIISRKAKPVKYSAASEKKGDLKYQTQRALKIGSVKRITEAGAVRNMPLLAVYDSEVVGATLAAQCKQAATAINNHLKRADKTKETVGKAKAKVRDAANKAFDSSVEIMTDLLLEAGLKEKDMVIGSSMFGKTMLVKLSDGSVVSIGKSDATKFRDAVKAARAAE